MNWKKSPSVLQPQYARAQYAIGWDPSFLQEQEQEAWVEVALTHQSPVHFGWMIWHFFFKLQIELGKQTIYNFDVTFLVCCTFIPQLLWYLLVMRILSLSFFFSFLIPLWNVFLWKLVHYRNLIKTEKQTKSLRTSVHTTSLVSCVILPEQRNPFHSQISVFRYILCLRDTVINPWFQALWETSQNCN